MEFDEFEVLDARRVFPDAVEADDIEALRRDSARYHWLRVHGNRFFSAAVHRGVREAMDAEVDAEMRLAEIARSHG